VLAGLAREGSRSWSPMALLIASAMSAGMFDAVVSPSGRVMGSQAADTTPGHRVIYLLPLLPGKSSRPHAETVHWSALSPRAVAGPVGSGSSKHGGSGSGVKPVPPPPDPVTIPDPGDGGRVYIESEMGRPVRRDPASAAPAYPDFLQKQGIEGVVAVEYIVDTTGLADSASLRIIRTSHPAFAEAVRAALPGMRFEPGEVGGQLVRQLVTQEFRFIISAQQLPATPASAGRHRSHSGQ
jgi:TonB family protein